MKEKPTYYITIPPEVRYHPKLGGDAKLLYGEIALLAQTHGYCWATNRYFAELYSVSENTASNWIQSLKDCGFISIDYHRTNTGTERRIYLTSISNAARTPKNLGANNTSNNNTREEIDFAGSNDSLHAISNTPKYWDKEDVLTILKPRLTSRYERNNL